MDLDWEKRNAMEWDMTADSEPGLKVTEQDSSDEDFADYADYVQAQNNIDEDFADYADYVQAQNNTDEDFADYADYVQAQNNTDEDFADYADYVQAQNNTNEDSGWQQVSYKKQSAKVPAKPPGKASAKLAGKPPGRASRGLPARSSARFPRPSPGPSTLSKATLQPKNILPRSPVRTMPPPAPPPQVSRLPAQSGPTLPVQRARPRVTFTTKSDNPAKAAFRAHQPHADTFLLPRACHLIEPDRPKMYAVMEEMGVRLGSFIRPPQHLRDQTLLLWGDSEQVAATKEELEMWIRQSDTTRVSLRGPHFAKASYLTEEKSRQLERGIRREMERQAFQKAPPPDRTFNCMGYFLWPVDEIRPEELLGPSFEAFDQIRMLHCAYIVFDNQHSVFKIMSDNMDGVKDAIQRIQGTMKEYVARSSQDIVLHVIEAPSANEMRKDIKTSGLNDPDFEGARIPVLTGAKLPQNELVKWENQRKRMTDEQFDKMRIAVRKGFSRLRYYRGRIRMRVLLGTFALTTFRRLPEGVESIPFDRFLGDMNMSATRGRMIKDLQMKAKADNLLAQIFSATKLFAPIDIMATALQEVAPVYTAQFVFEIPGTGKVQLELEMNKPGSEGLYERSNSVWTRVRDKSENVNPIEIFVVRLQGGISWALQVSTSNLLDPTRINPTMTAFDASIKFKLPPVDKKPEISGRRVFFWSRGLRILRFEQKTALRFRLASDSSCMFEFARYDTYEGPAATSPSQTQWGASYWNCEWDRTLSQNAGLLIGKSASWDPQINTFFPRGYNCKSTGQDVGLKTFIGVMTDIVELLDKVREK